MNVVFIISVKYLIFKFYKLSLTLLGSAGNQLCKRILFTITNMTNYEYVFANFKKDVYFEEMNL